MISGSIGMKPILVRLTSLKERLMKNQSAQMGTAFARYAAIN